MMFSFLDVTITVVYIGMTNISYRSEKKRIRSELNFDSFCMYLVKKGPPASPVFKGEIEKRPCISMTFEGNIAEIRKQTPSEDYFICLSRLDSLS